ncbi:MAG: hypothetical protein GY864_13675 [Desulfobacterales bacterium]|nr:hypothetical protein [Desulfobacterales bacterium]
MIELRSPEPMDLPDKPWALKGKENKNDVPVMHVTGFVNYFSVIKWHEALKNKYKAIEENEIRYETKYADDAELLIVSYGSTAGTSTRAIEMARAQGMKVGLFRPITLWPYPSEALRKAAGKAKQILCVEDSNGQMQEDVDLAIQGKVPVHYLGMEGRSSESPQGLIFPERVYAEIAKLLGKS